MSNLSGHYGDKSEDPLTEDDRKLIKKVTSDPLSVDQRFIFWLDQKTTNIRANLMDRVQVLKGHTVGALTLFTPDGTMKWALRWTADGLAEALSYPIMFNTNYTGTAYGNNGAAPVQQSLLGGAKTFPSDGIWDLTAWCSPRTVGGTFQVQRDGVDTLPYGGIHCAAGDSVHVGQNLGGPSGDPTATWDLTFESDAGIVGAEMRSIIMLWPNYVYPLPGGDPAESGPLTNTVLPVLSPPSPAATSDVIGTDDGTWTGTVGDLYGDPISFTYQWQGSADGLTLWSDIPGETANTLTIPNIGFYRCRVTGSVNYGSTTLTVSSDTVEATS